MSKQLKKFLFFGHKTINLKNVNKKTRTWVLSSLETWPYIKGLSAELIKLKKSGPNWKAIGPRRFWSATLHGTNWQTHRQTNPKNISHNIIIIDALIICCYDVNIHYVTVTQFGERGEQLSNLLCRRENNFLYNALVSKVWSVQPKAFYW